MRRGKRLAGQGFKVHHIDRILWAGNSGNRFLGRGDTHQRATGEEAEEFATSGQAAGHGRSLYSALPRESV